MPTKKKTAKKTAAGSKKTAAKAHKTAKKTATGRATSARQARPTASGKRAATASGKAKKKPGESQRVKKNTVTWAARYKATNEAPGPWTCPKCGALPQRAQPLYGEDERHHCPNLDCDSVVTLLSKEDLEPAEKRGSWPPQRNKNKAIAGGAPGSLSGPPPGAPPPVAGDD